MSYSSLDPDSLTLFVHMYCQGAVHVYFFHDFYVGPTHLLFIVLAMMSMLSAFVLSHMPSRNPGKQHTVVCCIRGTSL